MQSTSFKALGFVYDNFCSKGQISVKRISDKITIYD